MFSSIALFAGSDGLAFGIEKAEFNTLACFEFDKNPAKLISDKTIYCTMWEESIGNEDFCQCDKSNNKGIGYFFRRIFQYTTNYHVPPNGEEGGQNVFYTNPGGVTLPNDSVAHIVYVGLRVYPLQTASKEYSTAGGDIK